MKEINLRFALICFTALSVSLPIAVVSIAKTALFVFCLFYLISNYFKQGFVLSTNSLNSFTTPYAVIFISFYFYISTIWVSNTIDVNVVYSSLIKHMRIIEVIILAILIKNAKEARFAIIVFLTGQFIYLLSSWLLFLEVPIPWQRVHDVNRGNKYVVFSTYLDQSIIFITTTALYWNLRTEEFVKKWKFAPLVLWLLICLSFLNVLLILPGRTAYAIMTVLFGLFIFWSIPHKLRKVSVILSLTATIVLFFSLYINFHPFQEGTNRIISDIRDYYNKGSVDTSAGWRLQAWNLSIKAIEKEPLIGHGVGSWTHSVKQVDENAIFLFGNKTMSNPHQEYLLWGVELGVFGIILLLSFFICLLRDSLKFSINIQRSMIAVTLATACACLFNSTLYDGLIGDYFCVILGLIFAWGIHDNKRDDKKMSHV